MTESAFWNTMLQKEGIMMKSKPYLFCTLFAASIFTLIFLLTACPSGEEKLTVVWTEHTVASGFTDAIWVTAEDLDGDGSVDIVASSFNGGDIAWWKNIDGVGGFGSLQYVDNNYPWALIVCAATLDNDSDLDIIASSAAGDRVSWWENDGSASFTGETDIINNLEYAYGVCAADLDGDNDYDVVGTAGNTGVNGDRIVWALNNPHGTLTAQPDIESSIGKPMYVQAADFDGNDTLDVLAASYNDGLLWWKNENGDGSSWTQVEIETDISNANCVYAADIDGDGDPDVLATAIGGDGMIGWWENLGSGSSWTRHVLDERFGGARCVYAADVDEDGDLDVIGTARDIDLVCWFENEDGNGTFGTRIIIDADFDGANGMCASDVDGDGDVDVVAAARYGGVIAWWEKSLE